MAQATEQRRVALVTGASSGFGALTATTLVARGFRVFGTSRRGDGLPAGVEPLALDVDRDESVRACVDELLRRTGRLDVLVNNAGRALAGACEETSATEARALFETNVFGVMRVVSAVLPTLRKQGSGAIVNVGSLSGFVGVPFHGVYAASKHALAGYSESLRFELARFGVRVSLVEPAAHNTGIQMIRPDNLLAVYDEGRARVESVIRGQIDRGAHPQRVVDAIVMAALGRKSRLRFRVGFMAMLAAFARRFLPAGVLERAMRIQFQLPG
jgi:NAD(P)-dependent dehydrogenase (short-subunit alcohol dehydrogenase family)